MKPIFRRLVKVFIAVNITLGLFTGICFSDFSGVVVGVSDGDTIKVVTKEKKEFKVRLYGIDCPEKKQDFGMVAKDFTSSLVYGKNVEVKEIDVDRYGRTVGVVLLENWKELNSELLKAGLAWWYEKYSKEKPEYEELELKARNNKKGIWGTNNPINPEEYRKKKRSMN